MKQNNQNRRLLVYLFYLLLPFGALSQPADTLNGDYFTGFSAKLLESVREKRPVDDAIFQLKNFNPDILSAALNNDHLRKAFWINIYNAAAQLALQNDSSLILEKAAFPEKSIIYVARKQLSLDFILHRVLRRSKNKFGLGYVNRVFISDYERLFRTEFVDYRVHFGLNNGSASGGAIDIFRPETIEDQLNRSTVFYLHKECVYNDTTKTISLPRMLEWYKADFGGEKGMLQFLEKLLIIPVGSKPKIRYREYDWRPKLHHFL
jgi:hypothetical protein